MRKISLIFSLVISFLFTQNNFNPAYMASFGSVTIDGKLYNQISFRPEFSTNKIGMGFDIYLYFDEDGKLYRENWDFTSPGASFKTLVDKIYYFRYGQVLDDLYFRIGALPKVTLGQGILINQYANNIDYPQIRRAGIDLRYQFSGFKLQFIHSDLKEINKPGLIGLRTSIPIIENFNIGFSIASDFNQYNGLVDSDGDNYPDFVEPDYANDPDYHHENQFLIEELQGSNYCGYDSESDSFLDGTCENLFNDLSSEMTEDFADVMNNKDNVTGLAIDFGFELDNKFSLYTEYAQLLGKTLDPTDSNDEDLPDFDTNLGYGFIPIGMKANLGSVKLSLDYRRNSENFIFSYWNKNYDHNRIMENNGELITKESTLYKYGDQKGLNFGLEANISKYFKFSFDYEKMKGEMWNSGSCDNPDLLYENENDCESSQYLQYPDLDPEIQDNQQFGVWTPGAYKKEKNNSLYLKIEIDTSIIPQVQIAEIFYQQTNSKKPFKFEPNQNSLFGYNIGVNLSNNMIVLLKGRKSYDFDGSNFKPVYNTQIETSIYF